MTFEACKASNVLFPLDSSPSGDCILSIKNQQKNLLSIGAFAEMTRHSIKALRLYDQLDILKSHHVDPQSG